MKKVPFEDVLFCASGNPPTMRELRVSTEVAAPSDFCLSYLHNYFRERSRSAPALAHLHFPLEAIGHGLALEKQVAVRLSYPVSSEGRTVETLEMRWNPEGGGPFPNFDGTVEAAASGPDRCTLSIAGRYEPPGGAAGAMFDAVAGARIAHATLTALLREFHDLIEADYRLRTKL